jgi:hypothetical protein
MFSHPIEMTAPNQVCAKDGFRRAQQNHVRLFNNNPTGQKLSDCPSLRASNKGFLKPRVARGQKVISLHPHFYARCVSYVRGV